MPCKALVKDWLPPAAVRLGRRLLDRFSAPQPAKLYRSLLLPADHALPLHQSQWRCYDAPIRQVADAVRRLQPAFCAIDIGANVGDTAAAITGTAKTPVLCIEGDPAYFRFLDHNAQTLGPQIVVEKCFVGEADGAADAAQLQRRHGTTAGVRLLPVAGGALPIRRLETILERHPAFAQAELVKIDTDGADFRIILAHQAWLAQNRPVLFFENVVDSTESYEQALECCAALMQQGYEKFLVFDNYGNYLLTTGALETLRDLQAYLLSHARHGTAVHYFDLCAVPARFAPVADLVRAACAGNPEGPG